MMTTAMFVEIFVIGVQTMTWIILLVAAGSLGGSSLFDFAAIKDLTPLILVFLIPWVYTVGIVTDRMADLAFGLINKRFLDRKKISGHEYRQETITVLNRGSDAQVKTVNYYRGRLRVLRSSIWNVPLVCLSGLILAHSMKELHCIMILASLLITGVVIASFRKMSLQCIGLIQSNFDLLKNSPQNADV